MKKVVEDNSYNANKDQEFFVADALFGDGSKENPITITMTSRTCLTYIRDQAETCIPQFAWDGTFKVNDIGYPLIVTVTQDGEHTIFPTSFYCCKHRIRADFFFRIKVPYESLRNVLQKKHHFQIYNE